MKEALKRVVGSIALGLEAGAGLIIAVGAIKALARLIKPAFSIEGMLDVNVRLIDPTRQAWRMVAQSVSLRRLRPIDQSNPSGGAHGSVNC